MKENPILGKSLSMESSEYLGKVVLKCYILNKILFIGYGNS